MLSSRYEGFGLVLIEVMSQGCACITCDHKGKQREIMNPGSPLAPLQRARKIESCENGMLCPPEDVEALAAAMAKMIEDDEYRESVRGKAVERSKYYSVENELKNGTLCFIKLLILSEDILFVLG